MSDSSKPKRSIASIVLNTFTHDSRVEKQASSLTNAGNDVTVVAIHADQLERNESRDGYQIHRIRLHEWLPRKNIVLYMMKYVEFVAKAVWSHRRADVYHCHDLNALPVGVAAKVLFNRRANIVYDCHEYETEIAGFSEGRKKAARFLERRLIKYADEVITVSKSIARDYAKLYNIPEPHLIFNAPHLVRTPKSRILRESLGIADDKRIVLLQGTLQRGRGIDAVLASAEACTDESLAFVFMGYGGYEGKILEAAKRCDNVYLQPVVPVERILEYSSSADVGLSVSEDVSLSYRYGMPNKLFEYVMAGIPAVVSNMTEVRLFIEETGVGAVAEDFSPEEMLDAIQRAFAIDPQELSERLESTQEKFNWEVQELTLLAIYDELQTGS